MCGIGILVTRRRGPATPIITTPPTSGTESEASSFMIDGMVALIKARGPDHVGVVRLQVGEFDIDLAASVLQLRGVEKTPQPLEDKGTGNFLCWNGEIFGGPLKIPPDENDTRALLTALSSGANDPIAIVNSLEGPYAFVFFHAASKTLFFGRDVWGRRSLLQTCSSSALFALCSVAVKSKGNNEMWSELPINALFSLKIPERASELENFSFQSAIRTHKRTHGVSLSEDMFFPLGHRAALPAELANSPPASQEEFRAHAKKFLAVLSEAVRVRVTALPFHRRVGVLFSGGLDSSVLALLAHLHIDESVPIDLLNVAFYAEPEKEETSDETEKQKKKQLQKQKNKEKKKQKSKTSCGITREGAEDEDHATEKEKREKEKEAKDTPTPLEKVSVCVTMDDQYANVPDRKTGLIALEELKRLAPKRKWNFVEVNVTAAEVEEHRKEICDLIYPGNTMLDITIGAAFFFAARGRGHLRSSASTPTVPYTTDVRVLLMGNGADEQLAGYGRHRTAFLKWGGWNRLQAELDLDTARLWKRNLGRDDRVVSAHAREVRQPYLDENVVRFINSTPLSLICNMLEKPGEGDKKLLREVGILLGFDVPAQLVKKAIQFGSRVKNILSPKSSGSDVFDE